MSEPDDKPDNEAGKASPPKSLFDSNWALLGPSASGSGSSPIFAPPKPAGTEARSKPADGEDPTTPAGEAEPASVTPVIASHSDKLPAANSAPRTSAVAASVSGEFLAPEPRPEPETPPRYEPPEGVTPDYANADDETADSLPILPPPGSDRGSSMDDESDPFGKVIEFGQPSAPVEYEKPRARPPESFEIEDEASEAPERGGVSKLGVVVGVLAAVGLIALFVSKSRDGQRDSPTASASAGEESGPSTKQPRTRPGPKRDPSESGSDEVDTGSDESGSDESGAGETGELPKPPKPKPSNVDPRDPSLIPPGTPEENAKAFIKLPVSIHDGPPIGGIGRTGIHIDEVSTSRGRDNTDCDQPTEQFSMGVAKYVNVCFRVVHLREQESLRVIWEKDGKVTRRGRVRIPEVHAYTTRAYLLLRPEYVGNWRVRIVPEGEEAIDLAVAEFVITE